MKTRETAIYPKDQAIAYLTLGLTSEAGEVADLVKKNIRDGKKLDHLPKELGDVLWYVARLCDETGYKLSDIASDNIEKLLNRKETNTISGSGETIEDRKKDLGNT